MTSLKDKIISLIKKQEVTTSESETIKSTNYFTSEDQVITIESREFENDNLIQVINDAKKFLEFLKHGNFEDIDSLIKNMQYVITNLLSRINNDLQLLKEAKEIFDKLIQLKIAMKIIRSKEFEILR